MESVRASISRILRPISLQSPGYVPSIWLVFEYMSHRVLRNEFLEEPYFVTGILFRKLFYLP